MISAAEVKRGSTYTTSQDDVPLRTCFIGMGHPQPPPKLQIDNTTAEAFSKGTLNQKRSKSKNIHFYWLQYHKTQGQFEMFWRPGKDNLGDYQTKHHYPDHHRLMRSKLIHTDQLINNIQLCLLKGLVKCHVNVRTRTHKEISQKNHPSPTFYTLSLITLKIIAPISLSGSNLGKMVIFPQ